SFDDFRASSVTESDLDLLSCFAFGRIGIWRLDRGGALGVVDHSLLRNQQRVLMLVEHNLGVRRHVGSQLTGSVVDRNSHFKADHVVLLDTERRNLRDASCELTVLERLYLDARHLLEPYKTDVGLVHFSTNKNFAYVAEHHYERGAGTHIENR